MIPERIEEFLDLHHIRPARVVIALSGGVDSTALLLGFLEVTNVDITCAHVNHHLRGAESDEDERFVRGLCETHGVPLVVADGTLESEAIRRSGVEAAARDVRHARLSEIADSARADYIATAHQKNDQAETILMRVITGSGLAGLRGVHPFRDDGLIRPLLEVTRGEIESFVASRGVTPRIDRSNSDPRFLRNRVRAMIRELGDAAMENLAAVAGQAQQLWPVVERAIDEVERSCARVTEEETQFVAWPDDGWSRQALLYRHIRRLGDAREVSARDLERLAGSVDSIRRVTVTRDLEIVRRGETLILRQRPRATAEFELALDPGGSAVFIPDSRQSVSIRRAAWRDPRSDRGGAQLIQLPEGSEPHFTIRNRRRGDRFRPLGLQHDKKLKDFLNDRKIAPEVRDRIPLLIWKGDIVLIAGVEVSELFKVTSPGGELYEVTVEDESHHQNRAGIQR